MIRFVYVWKIVDRTAENIYNIAKYDNVSTISCGGLLSHRW